VNDVKRAATGAMLRVFIRKIVEGNQIAAASLAPVILDVQYYFQTRDSQLAS